MTDIVSLLKKAPPMTPDEMREQRISFAFGNASLDNPNVTKDMVKNLSETEEGAEHVVTKIIGWCVIASLCVPILSVVGIILWFQFGCTAHLC